MTHHRAKLDEAKVREIRRRHAAGESQFALSHDFRVSQPTISQIVHRSTWRHVDRNDEEPAPGFRRKDYERFISETCGDKAEHREAMWFVLAALHLGPEPSAIAEATGVPIARCKEYAENAAKSGVYQNGKWIVDEGFGEKVAETNMEIVLLSLAVQGLVVRIPAESK